MLVITATVASSEIGRVLQLMRAAEKGKKALAKAVEAQARNIEWVSEAGAQRGSRDLPDSV